MQNTKRRSNIASSPLSGNGTCRRPGIWRIYDKSRESICSFGFYGPSGETRLHFLPGGKKIDVLPPSSRRQATVHRTVAFDRSSLAFKRKMQAWHKAIPAFLVRVARLELAASCSQSRRATNCATPGYHWELYSTAAKKSIQICRIR